MSRKDYRIDCGHLVETTADDAPLRLYTAPTESERAELIGRCQIDGHTLDSALDPEEAPRLDIGPECTFIVWKRPRSAEFRTQVLFDVSSLAFVVQPDRLTIIAADDPPQLERVRTRPLVSLHDILLREMLATLQHYLEHLRVIKSIARSIQLKLNLSIGNQYLINMFSLSESLIYYVSAIEGNGGTLARMRASADELELTPQETRLLDDTIVENDQCGRQATIYSQVTSGLMDARGAIINNNMNTVLKQLMVLNTVFLPLGVLVGALGMSEYSMMTEAYPWWISYPAFLGLLIVLGLATWLGLRFWMNRQAPKDRTRSLARWWQRRQTAHA